MLRPAGGRVSFLVVSGTLLGYQGPVVLLSLEGLPSADRVQRSLSPPGLGGRVFENLLITRFGTAAIFRPREPTPRRRAGWTEMSPGASGGCWVLVKCKASLPFQVQNGNGNYTKFLLTCRFD